MSSDEAYLQETLNAAKAAVFKSSTITSSSTTTSALSTSKTIGIETIPIITRELSTQSAIPDTKETGIQIHTDTTDKSSQIEQVRTRDGSSQSEFARNSTVVVGSAPFANTAESRFSSKIESSSSSNVSRNFSYSQQQQQQQQSVAFSSSSTTGMIGASSSSVSRTATIAPVSADYSTTLIKDINQHYEPVELILNRSDSVHSHHAAAHNSSSTIIKEVEDFNHHHHHHHHQQQQRQVNRFEPVNLIFPRPFYGMGRSGSLPPVVSRVNYKSTARSDFEHTDTEDDSSYYYQHQADNKENYATYAAESKLTYYKGIERKARPQFKPVELVLDASSLSDSGNKRYRDNSYPASMQSKRIRTPVTSAFIYDNSAEYDSSTSDFISDQQLEARYKQSSARNTSMEEKESRGLAVKLPGIEMTIDLKAPPTIETPLKNVHSAEGQFVKLECVVNGNKLKQF